MDVNWTLGGNKNCRELSLSVYLPSCRVDPANLQYMLKDIPYWVRASLIQGCENYMSGGEAVVRKTCMIPGNIQLSRAYAGIQLFSRLKATIPVAHSIVHCERGKRNYNKILIIIIMTFFHGYIVAEKLGEAWRITVEPVLSQSQISPEVKESITVSQ